MLREVKPNVAPRRAARREMPARDLESEGRYKGSTPGVAGGAWPGKGTAVLAWPLAWEVSGDHGVRWAGRLRGQEMEGAVVGVGVEVSSIELVQYECLKAVDSKDEADTSQGAP